MADDVIPWPLDAEVWAWALSIITGVDRFSFAVLWIHTRAWHDVKRTFTEAYAWSQYLGDVGAVDRG